MDVVFRVVIQRLLVLVQHLLGWIDQSHRSASSIDTQTVRCHSDYCPPRCTLSTMSTPTTAPTTKLDFLRLYTTHAQFEVARPRGDKLFKAVAHGVAQHTVGGIVRAKESSLVTMQHTFRCVMRHSILKQGQTRAVQKP